MMNRGRMMPPSFFEDEAVLALSFPARWTWMGVRMYADDEGREIFNVRKMYAAIYGEEYVHEVTQEAFEDHLLEIMEAGLIQTYKQGRRDHFWIPSFDDAKVRIPTKSRLPAPPPKSLESQLFTNGDQSLISTAEQREGREREEGEWVGEGDSEGEGAQGPEGARGCPPGSVPDPFCPKHPGGTNKPCKPCGNARLAFRKWEADQIAARGVE